MARFFLRNAQEQFAKMMVVRLSRATLSESHVDEHFCPFFQEAFSYVQRRFRLASLYAGRGNRCCAVLGCKRTVCDVVKSRKRFFLLSK